MPELMQSDRVLPHSTNGGFCEQCCRQIALPKNPIVCFYQDLIYITHECGSAVLLLLKRLCLRRPRKERHTHDEEGGSPNTCLACLSSFSSTGSDSLDQIKEWLHQTGRLIMWLGAGLAMLLYGILMILVTLFPSIVRSKSMEEREREREEDERKDREWREKQKELADYFEERDEQWRRHNRDVTVLNGMTEAPLLRTTLLEDDQRVGEINSAADRVRNGIEDPDKLEQMRNELTKFREDEERKDGRRRQKLGLSRDKDALANRLFREADDHQAEGDYDKAERCRRAGYAARSAAEQAYREYRTI